MTAVNIEVKTLERGLVEHLAAPVICMDTCVILVSNTVTEDHNHHLSWKRPHEDKTDMCLSKISSFESIVAVYVGLPCELFKPHFI